MIKKGQKKRILILLLLLIVVLGMAIGYATLSQTIDVFGTAKVTSDWDIKIIDFVRSSGDGVVDKENSLNYNDTTANLNVDLKAPGAYATYSVTIKNNGNVPAKLNSISGITEVNDLQPVEIQFSTNAQINDTLNPGESKSYTITVEWIKESNKIPDIKSKTVSIMFNYIQNT